AETGAEWLRHRAPQPVQRCGQRARVLLSVDWRLVGRRWWICSCAPWPPQVVLPRVRHSARLAGRPGPGGGYFEVKVTSDRPEISISSPSAREIVTSGTLNPSSAPRISFVAGSPQSS